MIQLSCRLRVCINLLWLLVGTLPLLTFAWSSLPSSLLHPSPAHFIAQAQCIVFVSYHYLHSFVELWTQFGVCVFVFIRWFAATSHAMNLNSWSYMYVRQSEKGSLRCLACGITCNTTALIFRRCPFWNVHLILKKALSACVCVFSCREKSQVEMLSKLSTDPGIANRQILHGEKTENETAGCLCCPVMLSGRHFSSAIVASKWSSERKRCPCFLCRLIGSSDTFYVEQGVRDSVLIFHQHTEALSGSTKLN